MKCSTIKLFFLAVFSFSVLPGAVEADQSSANRLKDQEALKEYGTLVGQWRGAGQPRRGSRIGAWRESASWAWELTESSAALAIEIEDGKWLRSGLLHPDFEKPSQFRLDAVFPDESIRSYVGSTDERGRLLLEASVDTQGMAEKVARITITPLHKTRVLILFEGRRPGSKIHHRLAEVGYTREGVTFAAGDGQPECIVTGGRGTIPVTFEGKTYYVCCTGCKDLFDEDPASILAEYREQQGKDPQ